MINQSHSRTGRHSSADCGIREASNIKAVDEALLRTVKYEKSATFKVVQIVKYEKSAKFVQCTTQCWEEWNKRSQPHSLSARGITVSFGMTDITCIRAV